MKRFAVYLSITWLYSYQSLYLYSYSHTHKLAVQVFLSIRRTNNLKIIVLSTLFVFVRSPNICHIPCSEFLLFSVYPQGDCVRRSQCIYWYVCLFCCIILFLEGVIYLAIHMLSFFDLRRNFTNEYLYGPISYLSYCLICYIIFQARIKKSFHS